jgi:regulation of enolase protein 1 (concanavalin A-like superfamily)
MENVIQVESNGAPAIEWNKTYGTTRVGSEQSVVQTNDGGYAIVSSADFGTGWVFWLIKTDSTGNAQWNKTYGDTIPNILCVASLVQTGDGGYAIAGNTNIGGYGNAWLVKTDSSGNMQWNKSYTEIGWAAAWSLIQTNDGGYVIAGMKEYYDGWLMKTDANGTIQWSRSFVEVNNTILGSVVQTNDGGYIAAGATQYPPFSGKVDAYVVKTDSDGNTVWSREFSRTPGHDYARSIIQISDGSYAITGETDHWGNADFWLIKTDASGNFLLDRTYGGTGWDGAKSIVQTTDGGYVLAGQTNSFGAGGNDFWLVKTDTDGNVQWNETFGGAGDDGIGALVYDMGSSVVQTRDGGYALCGYTNSFSGDGSYQVWLIKLFGTAGTTTPFSDEFDAPIMDGNWTTIDQDGGSSFDLTTRPGWLRIMTISPPWRDLYVPVGTNAPRVMLSAVNGSFIIETKVDAQMNESFESGGILVWKDSQRFIRLERAFGGNNQEVFLSIANEGEWSQIDFPLQSNVNPTYLRLIRAGDSFSGYYSLDGFTWSLVGNYTLSIDDPVDIGLAVVNVYREGTFFADFDYFRVTAKPIVVPDDYPTIQAAINAASDDDTIFVRNGTYYEHLTINKTIGLIGESKFATIIDGEYEDPPGLQGRVVNVLADGVTMSGFTIQHCHSGGDAIAIDGYVNMTFSDNIITGCSEGVRILHSAGDIVSYNDIQGCYYNTGLGFNWVYNSTVYGNILANNNIGIGGNFWNITFFDNIIRDNVGGWAGWGISDNFYDCVFFHNNIINNGHQIYNSNTNPNVWDDCYPSGGNYWSDYTGVDLFAGSHQNETGSDGIGDTPYVIDANNTDNYPLMNPWSPPDLAVTNLTSAKTVIGQGYTGSVNVTFENLGNKIEAFNATVYANSTCIHSEQTMLAMTNCTLSFRWNTTGFAKGNYTISAYAEPVPGETNTADNNSTDAWVFVSMVGDLTGGSANPWDFIPDGKCDGKDIIMVALCFGSVPGDSRWNANCDVNNDGKVDGKDIVLVALHYGQADP